MLGGLGVMQVKQLAQCVQGPGFHAQHLKNKTNELKLV
jgi:hypothetical protein